MLNQIHIRDFAIIDKLELDLRAGMTVLTGETGAGKSILVDALGLVLGDRADSDTVRHNAKRAEISASFAVDTMPHILEWLEEHDLDEDGECILRRVISASRGSKGYINGRPVPLQIMKELGEMLVDIHGQHQHQSLLKADVQRISLDDFAGHQPLASEVATLHKSWKSTRNKLDNLRQAARDRDARIELLHYHIDELDALALEENELKTLEEEHKRLANGGTILEQCNNALAALYEGEEQDALSTLTRQLSQLETLRETDPRIATVCDLLSEAAVQIEEGCSELRHYVDKLDLDPQRLQWVEQRLSAIYDIARKHHVDAHQLAPLYDTFNDELAELENADHQLDELQKEVMQLEQRYEVQAAKLSKQRQKAAAKLAKSVTEIIHQLGMPNGLFQIALNVRDEQEPHPHGHETIVFEVAANPGQPAKPLSKVASGGELSRISLAIQVLLSSSQHIPTLIFDEVDTGIGGGVAETVGRQLRTLGQRHQVLCVTHLPQVAALGHQHLYVSKNTDGSSTSTQIQQLQKKQRQEEIARMLGGMEITPQTRAHAQEMIDRAAALS